MTTGFYILASILAGVVVAIAIIIRTDNRKYAEVKRGNHPYIRSDLNKSYRGINDE